MQYVKFDIDGYREMMRGFIGDGPETGVFWDALDFAFEAHGSQWRRSGDPYIMHPCSVARILAEELDIRDPEILAAALLLAVPACSSDGEGVSGSGPVADTVDGTPGR